jgi:hypothetical protein
MKVLVQLEPDIRAERFWSEEASKKAQERVRAAERFWLGERERERNRDLASEEASKKAQEREKLALPAGGSIVMPKVKAKTIKGASRYLVPAALLITAGVGGHELGLYGGRKKRSTKRKRRLRGTRYRKRRTKRRSKRTNNRNKRSRKSRRY